MAFDGVDFYRVDDLLSEEERAVLEPELAAARRMRRPL